MPLTGTYLGDRERGTSILEWATTNIANADYNEQLEMPSGFGDCQLLELFFRYFGITTMPSAPETKGPSVFVRSALALGVIDFAGTAVWIVTGTGSLSAHLRPENPIMLAQTEALNLNFASIDAGATVDGSVYARVLRKRSST